MIENGRLRAALSNQSTFNGSIAARRRTLLSPR
jgi:hypothetical protein